MNSTFNDRHHPKSEPNENSGPSPSLKVNKHSHVIKKPPSPSSTSSAAVVATGKPRQPVIIYTHIPRIIHTNPKDFMALVQNLTGMSRSDQDPGGNTTTGHREKSINRSVSDLTVDKKVKRNLCSRGHNNYHRNRKGILYNNESSSVITKDENIGKHGQFNSSQPYSAVAIPPPPQPPPPSSMYGTYFSTYPISPSDNPTENFLSGNQLFDDPPYLSPNMMNSFSSSSSSWFDGFEFL